MGTCRLLRAMKPLRLLLEISLALSGPLLLVGCVYIPDIFGKFESGTPKLNGRLDRKEHSDAPVHLGVTREQVIHALGLPRLETPDGRTLGYDSTYKIGYWVGPLCFSAEPTTRTYAARLDFDDAGILRNVQVRRADHDPGLLPVVS